MNRKSRSMGRRSSILKIELNKDEDTGVLFTNKNRRVSRRVSFAETYQVKEFPRDSPRSWKDASQNDENQPVNSTPQAAGSGDHNITGLDKLLTGPIQTPYQNVADFPIPDMSVDSFNIFDFNKTSHDLVDMETTATMGGLESDDMDFMTEPSMEIKFDASSFLKNLGVKSGSQTDSLQTTHIYSPHREPKSESVFVTSSLDINTSYIQDRSPLRGLTIQQNVHSNLEDRENMGQSFTNMFTGQNSMDTSDNEPTSIVDAKAFLNTLFGSKDNSKNNKMTVEEGSDDMEETTCFDGGIVSTADKSIAKLSAAMDKENISHSMSMGARFEDNVTKYYDPADDTVGIELTKCVGGIVAAGNNTTIRAESPANVTENLTLAMEETKPMGAICNLGGVMDKWLDTAVRAESPANVTQNITVAMEETRPIGSLIQSNKGNMTVVSATAMEETRPIGGIINDTSHLQKSVNFGSNNQTMVMEETKPVGGILNDSSKLSTPVNTSRFLGTMAHNETVHQIVTMEETKAIGGILESMPNSSATEALYGGSDLNTTTQQTVCMEETKAIGRILDKTYEPNDKNVMLNSGEVTTNFKLTNTEMMNIEETKCIGGIVEDVRLENRSVNIEDYKNNQDNTQSGEQTMCFEDVKTDWTCNDLETKKVFPSNQTLTDKMEETKMIVGIQNIYEKNARTESGDLTVKMEETKMIGGIETINKATHNTTIIDNVTMRMEETKCIGGLLVTVEDALSEKDNYLPVQKETTRTMANQTICEPTGMEETKCVTGILETGNDLNGHETINNIEFRQVDTLDEDDDGEITFKSSHKRSYEQVRESKEDPLDGFDDKTRDLTQNQTRLAQLKEMLVLSKKKTAAQLRVGTIKTPSKLSPNCLPSSTTKTPTPSSSLHLVTSSPLHKKQRLASAFGDFDTDMNSTGMDITEKTDTLLGYTAESTDRLLGYTAESTDRLLADVEAMEDLEDPTKDLTAGIDSEEMPDDMLGDFSIRTTSTVHHKSCNETIGSHGLNHTRHDETRRDLTANQSRGDVTVSDSQSEPSTTNLSSNDNNRSQMSMLSCKSFASSFLIPDGPLSLESFFKLTIKPASKVQSGVRCSAIFSQSIDIEDLAEVLQAELILAPTVNAKKKYMDMFKERSQKNEESVEWLQKTLLEIQPQIFQDTVNANDDELKEIIDRLQHLSSCCYNEADTQWKLGTTQMFTEALNSIQASSEDRARGIMAQIQSDTDTVDQLLCTLDSDLDGLDKTEKRLNELQQQQEQLNKSVHSNLECIEDKRRQECELRRVVGDHLEKHNYEVERAELRQQIQAHLVCVDWNLDEWEEDRIVFTFFNEELVLRLDLLPGETEQHITNIALKSLMNSSSSRFHERVGHTMAIEGIDTSYLMKKYTSWSTLPQLLNEVSTTIGEIQSFCRDVKQVNFTHKLYYKELMLSMECFDVETIDLIKVAFKFNPSQPLSTPVDVQVKVIIGKLRSADITSLLSAILPGPDYLSRLIKAIDLKQLHHS